MEDKAKCGASLYWHNCYRGSQDLYHSDAFQHPAKMAIPLAFRIMEHLKEIGLLKDEDVILDPMSGISTTGIVASALGHKFIGVELEDKFIELSKKNKEYAERKLYKGFDWQLIKGDSLRLSDLLKEQTLKSITSPPYGEALSGGGIAQYGHYSDPELAKRIYSAENANPEERSNIEKQIERVKQGRAKMKRPDVFTSEGNKAAKGYFEGNYSRNPKNIGNLKDKPLKSIVSPSYANDARLNRAMTDAFIGDDALAYGKTEGQVGRMTDKPLKSITSSPYETAHYKGDENPTNVTQRETERRKLFPNRPALPEHYSDDLTNIGNQAGESYLEAMLKVYQEISLVSDVLCVVIKNPTRNGKLRRLDLDTIKILEIAGWKIYCRHCALLFEELEQADMFAGSKKQVKGRLSFFKRLSWQNGQPVANFEDIIIAVRKLEV